MPDELGTVAAGGTAVADAPAPETIESPAPETPEGGEPGGGIPEGDEPAPETPEGDEPEPEGEPEGDEEEIEGADGRRVDFKTREALAALKKTNPEAAKRIGDIYHRAQAIIKDVGAANISDAVNKVRQMAATMEAVGGEEGLTELQGEVGDYRTEIKQFSEGDPALLNQLHEANPESFVTAIANGLDLILDKSPKLLDRALLPAMAARLEAAGMFNSMTQLAKLIQEGKGQEAYDLTGQIKEWLDKAKGLATTQKDAKSRVDPAQEANERTRQELAQQKQDLYNEAAVSDVNKVNNTNIGKLTESFFKDIKLNSEGRGDFKASLTERIWKRMSEDKPYLRAAEALAGKGDRARHVRFIAAKFNEYLPTEFKKLRDARYPNYKGGAKKIAVAAKPAGTNGKVAAPAAKAVPGKVYTRGEVDIDATPQVFIIQGKAFLKGTRTPVAYQR